MKISIYDHNLRYYNHFKLIFLSSLFYICWSGVGWAVKATLNMHAEGLGCAMKTTLNMLEERVNRDLKITLNMLVHRLESLGNNLGIRCY